MCVHLHAWVGERDTQVRRRRIQIGGPKREEVVPPALNPQDARPATVNTRPTSQTWRPQGARPGPGKAVTSRTAKTLSGGQYVISSHRLLKTPGPSTGPACFPPSQASGLCPCLGPTSSLLDSPRTSPPSRSGRAGPRAAHPQGRPCHPPWPCACTGSGRVSTAAAAGYGEVKERTAMPRQVRKAHGGGGWASHPFSVWTLDFTLNECCRGSTSNVVGTTPQGWERPVCPEHLSLRDP